MIKHAVHGIHIRHIPRLQRLVEASTIEQRALHALHVGHIPVPNGLVEDVATAKHEFHRCHGGSIPSTDVHVEIHRIAKHEAHVGHCRCVPMTKVDVVVAKQLLLGSDVVCSAHEQLRHRGYLGSVPLLHWTIRPQCAECAGFAHIDTIELQRVEKCDVVYQFVDDVVGDGCPSRKLVDQATQLRRNVQGMSMTPPHQQFDAFYYLWMRHDFRVVVKELGCLPQCHVVLLSSDNNKMFCLGFHDQRRIQEGRSRTMVGEPQNMLLVLTTVASIDHRSTHWSK